MKKIEVIKALRISDIIMDDITIGTEKKIKLYQYILEKNH